MRLASKFVKIPKSAGECEPRNDVVLGHLVANSMKQIVTTAHFLYTRTAGLVLTFFAFVLIQIVFGAFYYWLFRRNQNNFTLFRLSWKWRGRASVKITGENA